MDCFMQVGKNKQKVSVNNQEKEKAQKKIVRNP